MRSGLPCFPSFCLCSSSMVVIYCIPGRWEGAVNIQTAGDLNCGLWPQDQRCEIDPSHRCVDGLSQFRLVDISQKRAIQHGMNPVLADAGHAASTSRIIEMSFTLASIRLKLKMPVASPTRVRCCLYGEPITFQRTFHNRFPDTGVILLDARFSLGYICIPGLEANRTQASINRCSVLTHWIGA